MEWACFSSFETRNLSWTHMFLSDYIRDSRRRLLKLFTSKCPEVFIAGTFHREIIFRDRRVISSSQAAKCRFRKRNCRVQLFWNFSMFQGVYFPMSIFSAAGGSLRFTPFP